MFARRLSRAGAREARYAAAAQPPAPRCRSARRLRCVRGARALAELRSSVRVAVLTRKPCAAPRVARACYPTVRVVRSARRACAVRHSWWCACVRQRASRQARVWRVRYVRVMVRYKKRRYARLPNCATQKEVCVWWWGYKNVCGCGGRQVGSNGAVRVERCSMQVHSMV